MLSICRLPALHFLHPELSFQAYFHFLFLSSYRELLDMAIRWNPLPLPSGSPRSDIRPTFRINLGPEAKQGFIHFGKVVGETSRGASAITLLRVVEEIKKLYANLHSKKVHTNLYVHRKEGASCESTPIHIGSIVSCSSVLLNDKYRYCVRKIHTVNSTSEK